MEVDKHQFGDGAQTSRGGAYRCPNEASLSNGGVENALATKLLHQPFGDAQHTAPGVILFEGCHSSAAGNIFSHQNNSWIAAHLQLYGFVYCLGIRKLTNCYSHCISPLINDSSHIRRSASLLVRAVERLRRSAMPRR